MEHILRTTNLVKKYGRKQAVNNVNMTIEKGDIYGFIGKNGAGKTTLMRVVLGTAFATSGTVELFGSGDLNKQRSRIGALIEAPGLYKNCTALENLKRFSILYGGDEEKCKEILEFVGLGNVGKKKCGNFSLGMKQRMGIAIAMLGDPEFLILDEPINGLDPAGIKEVRDLILKLNREKQITFLISSHLLDELAKVVTKYGIINDGVLIEEISAEELMNRCRENLNIVVDDIQKAQSLLKTYDSNIEMEINDNSIKIMSNLDNAAMINRLLVENGVNVSELRMNSEGLEDYFVERIGQ